MTPHADARCAVHPEAPSVGACARCGVFRCAGCAVGLICRPCLRLDLSALPRTSGWAKVATVVVWVLTINRAAIVLIERLLGGLDALTPEQQLGYSALFLVVGLVGVLAWIGAMVALPVWQYRLMRRVEAMRLPLDDTPGMAVAWWFIPFANFVKPLHVMQSLGRVLMPTKSPTFVLWWMSWLGASLFEWLARALRRSAADTTLAVLQFIGLALFITSAVHCVRLIRMLDQALREKETNALVAR